jgi:helix-turn-helix protein
MATIDHIRNGIINKLLTISNKDYLVALSQLVENSFKEKDTVKLTEEQILMLQLSDDDIKSGKLINQSQIDKSDLKWLKEL